MNLDSKLYILKPEYYEYPVFKDFIYKVLDLKPSKHEENSLELEDTSLSVDVECVQEIDTKVGIFINGGRIFYDNGAITSLEYIKFFNEAVEALTADPIKKRTFKLSELFTLEYGGKS